METLDETTASEERTACKLSLARMAHLLPAGVKPAHLYPTFHRLCQQQEIRRRHGLPLYPIPLWVVALAELFDIRIDHETGVVARWPLEMPSALPLTVDVVTGRVIGWPVNAPLEVRP